MIGNDSLSSSIFASSNECQLTKSFQATRILHISSLLFAERPSSGKRSDGTFCDLQKNLMYHYIYQKCNKTATQMLKLSYPDQCYASNSLPNDNSLDLTKFKAFADNNLNVAKMVISVFDRTENTLGKEENAGYQHFLLFLQRFQKASFSRSFKVGTIW